MRSAKTMPRPTQKIAQPGKNSNQHDALLVPTLGLADFPKIRRATIGVEPELRRGKTRGDERSRAVRPDATPVAPLTQRAALYDRACAQSEATYRKGADARPGWPEPQRSREAPRSDSAWPKTRSRESSLTANPQRHADDSQTGW